MTQANHGPWLLAIVEMGGYPNFTPLYESLGFRVEMLPSVRKAGAWLKRYAPAVVVAEFSFDPGFRDRMGNLESLLAGVQRVSPAARVIVLIEPDHMPRLDAIRPRHPIFDALTFPIDPERLRASLERALASS